MKKYYFSFILFIFALFSCKNKTASIPMLDTFKSEYSLKGSIFNINDTLGYPGLIVNTPDYLVLQDKSLKNNFLYKIISKNNGQLIKCFGIKGKGPQEMLTPISLDYISENKIGVYDIDRMKYNIFSLDSIIEDSNNNIIRTVSTNFGDENKYTRCIKIVLVNNTKLIGICSHEKGRYAVFEDNGKLNDILYPDFPYDEDHKTENYFIKSFAFQYNIKVSPDNSKFCSAASTCTHLEIFDITRNSIEKRFDKLFNLPSYKNVSTDKMKGVAFLEDSQSGFNYINVTNDFIYVSYASEKVKYMHQGAINNYLLKFDWKGNSITKYKLESKIGYFTIDEKDNCVYATSSDTTTNEPIIIKFILP